MTFYSTSSQVISKIRKEELEEKFDIWSEGSPELKKLLSFCYQQGVVTSGCCRHAPYLQMDLNSSDLNQIAKMVKGAYEATGVRIVLLKGGNPYSGPGWYETIFNIDIGSKKISKNYIKNLTSNSDFVKTLNVALGEFRMDRALKKITNKISSIDKLLFYMTRNSIGKKFFELIGSYKQLVDLEKRLIRNEVFFLSMNEAVQNIHDNDSQVIKVMYDVLKMYKTLLDKEEYRLALYVVLQDNQANLDFGYDEGIVGFETYDKVFQNAGFELKIDGRHFVNLNCPISELQKIAKHLSSEFKKMDINSLELTEKASFNEKALIQQVKFGFSREGIEKMNQWINQNGWRKDKKVNY